MVVVACSDGVLVWRIGDRGYGRSSSVPEARAVVALLVQARVSE
jgi:hypothetical protein